MARPVGRPGAPRCGAIAPIAPRKPLFLRAHGNPYHWRKSTGEHEARAARTGAVVDGMVNYVQHQRLTLKFTDDKGVDRWFTVGRTGGGYGVGDTLPIRYNSKYPGRKRAIVVGF